VLALIIAVFAVLFSHYQLAAVKRESARRLAELQQAVSAATETATRADAEARAARQQAALLESKLAEELGQREALEQLYSDLSRGRDEAVLVEVERLITLAAQNSDQRQRAGYAGGTADTDARLARADARCRCAECWHATSRS
jgi:Sec-independent protein translocase protein TatA